MKRLLSHLWRAAAAGALLVAGAGAVAPHAAQAAGPYTVTLSASQVNAASGETVHLYAQSNTTPTYPHAVIIYNQTLGQTVCASYPGTYNFCDADQAFDSATYTYIAYVAQRTNPPSDIQAASNPVTVTWSPLGGTEASPSDPSQSCAASPTAVPVLDNFDVEGGKLTVVADINAVQPVVCYRVDVLNRFVGGRVGIHIGTPAVTGVSVALPAVDSQVTATGACVTPSPANLVPGTHPPASGPVLGQFVAVDTYASVQGGVAVCVTVGTTPVRVLVPVGVSGPGVSPNVTLILDKDPGTLL